ncbi:hypothetical protein [Burkholderia pseudomallei]|nr:hypothetical protein [Burkholderia pseudomallei]
MRGRSRPYNATDPAEADERTSRPVVGSRLAGLSIPIPRIGANEAIEFAPRACEPEFAARRRGMNGA